jgi:[ribosomal protein S5]-alanine N-acetyltransferase
MEPIALPLLTDRLLLRDFVPEDWRATHDYESDPQTVRYQSFAPFSEAESRDYIERNLKHIAERPRRLYDLALVQRADGRLIGRVGLSLVAPELHEAALWYILHRDCWGRGLMSEAAQRMLALGFAELGLHRIWADTDPRNAASIRLLEKLGMRREAHFRENVFIKDEWCDTLIYALLGKEWRDAAHAPCRRVEGG